jgi:hypothetical protein
MDARERDSPARARDHDVVGYGNVRPIRVERVDALQISWERKLRVGLPDDQVAVDQDILETIHGSARRQNADHALHAVLVIAVADVQIVMDVIFRDGEIACSVINSVIAKMVDLVV